MTKPVCLVIGAGAGIGGNVAKKFALEVLSLLFVSPKR
jgi:short-subunit dehydrogenase